MMKRGATRDEIIRRTQELIAHNGIRAVRVDEIAQMLGISKRTLYEIFADKTDLVDACLGESIKFAQRRIGQLREQKPAFRKLIGLLNEYVRQLYTVDAKLLSELRNKYRHPEPLKTYRNLWETELGDAIDLCQKESYLPRSIDPVAYGALIVSSAIELRIAGISSQDHHSLICAWIRGIATQKGIDYISRKEG